MLLNDSPAEALQFPYMHWMHNRSFQVPYSLAQSGMPVPEAGLLGSLSAAEMLAHPLFDAQPRFEAKIAQGYGVAPERVLVTVGASGAMHMCASHWFRAGTRVVTELPSYEPFRALPERQGAELALVQRRAEDGWQLDPYEVAERLTGASGPAHVFVSNPHNPTGVFADRERIAALANAAEVAGGVLISNEAYMDFVPEAERFHAHDLAANALTIGTLTKAYGLGPLRLGWIVLGEGLVDQRTHLLDMANLTWVDPPTPSLLLGLRALDHLPELLQPLREVERGPRRVWESWLRGSEQLDVHVPDFGIIAFPRVRGADDTLSLSRELANTHGVAVGAGEYFGMPGHIRVSCGLPPATLKEGLARLTTGIHAWLEKT